MSLTTMETIRNEFSGISTEDLDSFEAYMLDNINNTVLDIGNWDITLSDNIEDGENGYEMQIAKSFNLKRAIRAAVLFSLNIKSTYEDLTEDDLNYIHLIFAYFIASCINDSDKKVTLQLLITSERSFKVVVSINDLVEHISLFNLKPSE